MGFLTTITIYNDALHEFEKNPEAFGKAILEGISRANKYHISQTVPFGSYSNYIDCQPSFHADDHQLYIHYGNNVLNINPYGNEFERLKETNIESLKDYIKVADQLLKEAKKQLKDMDKE